MRKEESTPIVGASIRAFPPSISRAISYRSLFSEPNFFGFVGLMVFDLLFLL